MTMQLPAPQTDISAEVQYQSATDFSVPQGVWTYFSWDTKVKDKGGFIDLVGHPTRITIPATGLYLFTAHLQWNNPNTTSAYYSLIYKNRTKYVSCDFRFQQAQDALNSKHSFLADLNAGDYLELMVYTNAVGGTPITTLASADGNAYINPTFAIKKL